MLCLRGTQYISLVSRLDLSWCVVKQLSSVLAFHVCPSPNSIPSAYPEALIFDEYRINWFTFVLHGIIEAYVEESKASIVPLQL